MPNNSTRHAGANGLPAQDECEWDSETEGVESEKGFRVHVDLSEYWGSSGQAGAAAACVWVRRARGRRLRWLARRLRAAAALRRPFCLLLLPAAAALAPIDPLRLLRPADSLRVVPVEHEWQKSFSFCEDEDETEWHEPERNGGISSSSKTKHIESKSPAPLETMNRRNIESSLSPVSIQTTVNRTSTNEVEMEQAPVSACSPVSGAGDEALQSVKRRALALLASWRAGEADEARDADEADEARGADEADEARGADEADEARGADEADGAPPRRKRRRVRRRNKPGAAPAPAEPEAAPDPDPTPTTPTPPQSYRYADGEGSPPALVRNAAAPRPPRLVRPLPPPPPPAPNTEPAPRAVC